MTIESKIKHTKANNFERLLLLILCLLSTLTSFSSTSKTDQELFEEIILKYIKQFPEIPNKCNAKPFYKINFVGTNDTVKFWIAGHIGAPSLVPPSEPGTIRPSNPKELKGIIKINKQPFVIYDSKNSDGYGVYNPKSVNKDKLKKMQNISDDCAAGTINPEAWLIAIINGKISIVNKREPYKIQL